MASKVALLLMSARQRTRRRTRLHGSLHTARRHRHNTSVSPSDLSLGTLGRGLQTAILAAYIAAHENITQAILARARWRAARVRGGWNPDRWRSRLLRPAVVLPGSSPAQRVLTWGTSDGYLLTMGANRDLFARLLERFEPLYKQQPLILGDAPPHPCHVSL